MLRAAFKRFQKRPYSIAFVILLVLGIIMIFQNCSDIKVSKPRTQVLNSIAADCVHPTGKYPSNLNTAVEFFKEEIACSNLGQTCQSAFFKCDNGVWKADNQNISETINNYPFTTCTSNTCQIDPPPPPPPSCPNPLPNFQYGAWSAWSSPLGLCGQRTRTGTRTLPSGCNEPTQDVQTQYQSCQENPPGTLTPDQPCLVYSQYGQARCDSSYVFDLQAITAGAWAFISLPSSVVLSIPFDPTMNYNNLNQFNGGKFSLSATTMYPSCAAMMVELNITNRRGVIIGIKDASSPLAIIPANLITQDSAYASIIPNTNTEQADYEKCYVRGRGPTGQGDRAEIAYSTPSRPDSLDKKYSCVTDPALGQWYLNIRYSYPVPSLNTNGQFVMPTIGMCTLGIR